MASFLRLPPPSLSLWRIFCQKFENNHKTSGSISQSNTPLLTNNMFTHVIFKREQIHSTNNIYRDILIFLPNQVLLLLQENSLILMDVVATAAN